MDHLDYPPDCNHGHFAVQFLEVWVGAVARIAFSVVIQRLQPVLGLEPSAANKGGIRVETRLILIDVVT